MPTIIFDLDGMLLDTLSDLHASINFMLKSLGLPLRTKAEVKSFIGNGMKLLVQRSLGFSDEAIEKEAYQLFINYYESHLLDYTIPFDGVRVLLEVLKGRGFKIGVLTNKNQVPAETLCNHFFEGLIDVIVGGSESLAKKPDPNTTKYVLKLLGSSSAIYVGDSIVDAEVSSLAGLKGILVSYGYGNLSEMQTLNLPIVGKPLDIIDLLDK